MRRLLLILTLCASCVAQGTTVVPGTTMGPVTSVFPGTGGASVVSVIGSFNTTGNGPFTTTVTGNASVGDVVVVACVSSFTSAYSLTISDSSSNTWVFPTSGGANASQQYLDATHGGSDSFATSKITTSLVSGTGTITYTSGSFALALCTILDISHGVATVLDQASGHTATFGTTITTASITPSTQPEIAIAIMLYNTSGGAGFNAYGNVIGTAAAAGANAVNTADTSGMIVEWRRITATTAGTAVATVTGASVSGMTLFFTIECS
jgi:hypothetical protein